MKIEFNPRTFGRMEAFRNYLGAQLAKAFDGSGPKEFVVGQRVEFFRVTVESMPKPQKASTMKGGK